MQVDIFLVLTLQFDGWMTFTLFWLISLMGVDIYFLLTHEFDGG